MIAQPLVLRDSTRALYSHATSCAAIIKTSNEKKHRSRKRHAQRVEKQDQEDRMRRILRKHASERKLVPSLRSTSDRSLCISSSASEESVLSHQSQLLSMIDQKSFRHKRVLVTFEFGLLTSEVEAPPQGPYETLRPTIYEDGVEYCDGTELKNKSEMLFMILDRAGAVSTTALEKHSGNVLMFVSPERSSFITFVKRDYNYQSPQNRPGVVRCIVSAVIPISIASDGDSFTETSKIMARVIVRKALIEGVQKGQLYV